MNTSRNATKNVRRASIVPASEKLKLDVNKEPNKKENEPNTSITISLRFI